MLLKIANIPLEGGVGGVRGSEQQEEGLGVCTGCHGYGIGI